MLPLPFCAARSATELSLSASTLKMLSALLAFHFYECAKFLFQIDGVVLVGFVICSSICRPLGCPGDPFLTGLYTQVSSHAPLIISTSPFRHGSTLGALASLGEPLRDVTIYTGTTRKVRRFAIGHRFFAFLWSSVHVYRSPHSSRTALKSDSEKQTFHFL